MYFIRNFIGRPSSTIVVSKMRSLPSHSFNLTRYTCSRNGEEKQSWMRYLRDGVLLERDLYRASRRGSLESSFMYRNILSCDNLRCQTWKTRRKFQRIKVHLLRKLFACDKDSIKMEFVIYGWENWLVKLYVLSGRSAFLNSLLTRRLFLAAIFTVSKNFWFFYECRYSYNQLFVKY